MAKRTARPGPKGSESDSITSGREILYSPPFPFSSRLRIMKVHSAPLVTAPRITCFLDES